MIIEFDSICVIAVGLLAAISIEKYRFISGLILLEFLLHFLVYEFLFLDFRSMNSSVIYLFYIIIQALVLGLMYINQVHFIIAFLIFIDLIYNFCTVLQHLTITAIPFHDSYQLFARSIMMLEILYLLGITFYVRSSHRTNGFINITDIDNLFFIRRRLYNRNFV